MTRRAPTYLIMKPTHYVFACLLIITRTFRYLQHGNTWQCVTSKTINIPSQSAAYPSHLYCIAPSNPLHNSQSQNANRRIITANAINTFSTSSRSNIIVLLIGIAFHDTHEYQLRFRICRRGRTNQTFIIITINIIALNKHFADRKNM